MSTSPRPTRTRWRFAFWWLVAVAVVFTAGGVAGGIHLMLLTGPSSFASFGPGSQGVFFAAANSHPDLGVGVLVLAVGLLVGSAFGVMAAVCRRVLAENPATPTPSAG